MNFLKELLISATNGLFGRLLLVLIGVGGGFTVSKAITSNNSFATGIILAILNFVIVYSIVGFFRNLDVFKEWSQEQRQNEIRKLELEKEILELEIQRDNQQSSQDDKE